MNTYPRETRELVELTVTDHGQPVTVYDTALTQGTTRPATWTAAAVVDGHRGVLIDHLTAGIWHVWVRVTANPEVPVIYCGSINVT